MKKRNGPPWRTLALLGLACVLASCAPKHKVDIPAYPGDTAGQPSDSAPSAQPIPQGAPEQKAALPLPAGQTGVLLASANKSMEAKQFDKAEMQLERALRLAPRDPQLWHAMALVRFGQANYAQAVQFCLKSNSLAGKNRALLRQNWLLLEKAYLEMGDGEKAAHARRQAN